MTINNGGTILAEQVSPFGPTSTGTGVSVTVNAGGTLTTSGPGAWAPWLTLNGGTLAGTPGDYGTWLFNSDVTVGGSKTSTMSATEMSLYEPGGVNFTVGASSTLNVTGGFIAQQYDTGFIKQGPGTMILSGGNTYTAATAVNGGTLQIGNGGSGETLASQSISVSAGATLAFSQSDTLLYAGAISGSGQVTEQGGGTLILSGSNTYTGATTVSSGTLQIGNGGTGEALASQSISVSGGAALAFYQTDALTISPSAGITGDGALLKSGGGTLVLGGSNAYTGSTTISGGTLQIGNGLALQNSTVVAAGGGLDLNGLNATVGGLAGNGALTLNSGTLNVGNNNADTVYSGILGGTAPLVKTGAGTLTLSNANTYTGPTVVNAGTLAMGAYEAATLNPSSAVTINSGGTILAEAPSPFGGGPWPTVTINPGGLLTINNNFAWAPVVNLAGGTLAGTPGQYGNGTWIFNSDVVVGGSTTSTISATEMTLYKTGGVTFTVGADSTLNVTGGFGAYYQYDNGLIKQGPGVMILSGANTYTGPTTISDGTLSLVGGGGFNSNITNNSALVLEADSGSWGLANTIGGSGAVTKTGNGMVVLYGANTYSGATTVNAGTLALGLGGGPR